MKPVVLFALLCMLATPARAGAGSDAVADAAYQHAAQAKDRGGLEAALKEIDDAVKAGPTIAQRHYVRGQILSALGRKDDAIAAYQKAATLDPKLADAYYNIGTIEADAGKDKDAIAAWEKAIAIDPKHVDALYNAAQYYYNQHAYAKALARWTSAYAAAPGDFEILKKVVQADYALGKLADGAKRQDELVALWKASTDPQVQKLDEYVFDQFDAGKVHVMAYAPLRAKPGDVQIVLSFRDGAGGKARVEVETSDVAKQAGTPFVLGVTASDGTYKVAGAAKALPAYPALKKQIIALWPK